MALWWACQDLNLGPHPYQGSAQGLFYQDCSGGLRERRAAGDRWRPLGTARIRWDVDQTWTKPRPSTCHPEGFMPACFGMGACLDRLTKVLCVDRVPIVECVA